MAQFMAIMGRNLKMYFRDKGAVFLSLLSMFIVIGLMVFFLGDMNIEGITGFLADYPGRDATKDAKNAELLILTWTFAGIISINAVTITLGVYSVMIKDRVNGKLNSIYTAPVSRTAIASAYIATAWIGSVLVCTITLLITEVYGIIKGLEAYSLTTHLQLIGMIMVNSFVYAAIMYVVAILAKTEGAWSGFGTVVGTLVGFLGGIYIPIGSLSNAIAGILKCTPIIYGTSMFRSIMTKDILDKTFQGVPDEVITEYRKAMGIDLEVFGRKMGFTEEWLILFACGIIFLIVGICMLKYGKKTDRYFRSR